MPAIVFFIFLLFISLDLLLLKKQDAQLFPHAFGLSPLGSGSLAVLYLVMLIGSQNADEIFASWFLLLFLVYVFKRIRFKRLLPVDRKDPNILGLSLSLAIDAFGVILKWFGGMLVLNLGVKVIGKFTPLFSSELDEMVVMAAASFLLLIIFMVQVIRRHHSLGLRKVLGLTRNRQGWFKWFLVPFISGIILASLGALVVLTRSVQPPTPLSKVVETATSPAGITAFLVMAVILAPFIEEIIFRGFFFYVIEQVRGRALAVVVIALVFAGMHVEQYWGDWTAIAIVTVLGIILTMFRAWTGSSIPGIITHYVYNGLMTIIPVVFLVASNPSYYEYQSQFSKLGFADKKVLLLKSINEQPQFAGAYNDLAWLYAESGQDLDQALALVNQALALDPDNFAYQDTKAEVLYKKGEIPAAIAIAEALVREYPANNYARKQLDKFIKAPRHENVPAKEER